MSKLENYYYQKEENDTDKKKEEVPKVAPILVAACPHSEILQKLLDQARATYNEKHQMPHHAINILNCLCSNQIIDTKQLRELSFYQGIPDDI